MTQFAKPLLVPATDDGITLSTKSNGAWDALYSSHEGAAAPPSPVKGQPWIDTSGEGGSPSLHVMKVYDGTTFRTIGTLNRTSGIYAVAGNLPLVGGTLTGPILGASGTAAAPSYSFSGNANTGLYRIGANNVGLALGGVLRFNFGISLTEFSIQHFRTTAGSPITTQDRTSGAAGVIWTQYSSGGTVRYRWIMSGVESTGNAGADMAFAHYDDAGTIISNLLLFLRASRQISYGGTGTGAHAHTFRTPGWAQGEGAAIFNPSADGAAQAKLEFYTATTGGYRGGIYGVRSGSGGDVLIHASAAGSPVWVASATANGDWFVSRDVSAGRDVIAARNVFANGAITGIGTITGGAFTTGGSIFAQGNVNTNGFVQTPQAILGVNAGRGVRVDTTYTDGSTYRGQTPVESVGFDGIGFNIAWLHIFGNYVTTRITTNGTIFDFRQDGNGYAPGSWIPGSDTRLKSEQTVLGDVRDIIMAMVPKSYIMHGTRKFGLIAQETQTHLPDVVIDTKIPLDSDPEGPTMLGMDYNGVLAVMLRHIQSLETRLAALEGGA